MLGVQAYIVNVNREEGAGKETPRETPAGVACCNKERAERVDLEHSRFE